MSGINIRLSIYGTGSPKTKDEPFEVGEGESVLELLQRLDSLDMLPKRFGKEKSYQDLLVFVNHKNVASGVGFKQKLFEAEDKVLIVQAVAGG